MTTTGENRMTTTGPAPARAAVEVDRLVDGVLGGSGPQGRGLAHGLDRELGGEGLVAGCRRGRESYGPSDVGGFCDGIAFDAYGNLWSTLIMAERLIAITPEGDLLTLFDDGVPEAVAELDRAYRESAVTPELMAAWFCPNPGLEVSCVPLGPDGWAPLPG